MDKKKDPTRVPRQWLVDRQLAYRIAVLAARLQLQPWRLVDEALRLLLDKYQSSHPE